MKTFLLAGQVGVLAIQMEENQDRFEQALVGIEPEYYNKIYREFTARENKLWAKMAPMLGLNPNTNWFSGTESGRIFVGQVPNCRSIYIPETLDKYRLMVLLFSAGICFSFWLFVCWLFF